MATRVLNAETICDVTGTPLASGSVTVLKALDKLLTVGAYYSADHDQYLIAARKSRDALVGVIGGPRQSVAIEITSQGLMLSKQNIDPHHRNVRQLHELLVPLNIARLEIDGSLTPEDLRQAIAALQAHRTALGHAHIFQEVVIEGLPASVRAVSRSVLHRADGNDSRSPEEVSLDELLGKWGDQQVPAYAEKATPDSEKLARRFMEMVNGVVGNLERIEEETGVLPVHPQDGRPVTKKDLRHLKEVLARLVEVNPDPAELLKLIDQAQRALDLSRDAKSVNLVFAILKKDLAGKNGERRGGPDNKGAKSPPLEFKSTVEEIVQTITDLARDGDEVSEPHAGSVANQLGICLHLLRSDPPRALKTALIDQLTRCAGAEDFAETGLLLCARAMETVARDDGVEALDDLLPQITSLLRREQAGLTGRFWTELTDLLGDDQIRTIWPHLVNDILLGFTRTPRETTLALVMVAARLDLPAAIAEGRRLEKQPAFQGQTASRDLFLAPLASLHPLLTILMTSSLKAWVSKELYRALCKRPPSPLIGVVMAALGGYQPEHTLVCLSLVGPGADDMNRPELREQTALILHGALTALTGHARQQAWVPRAIGELARLEPELARPVLRQILTERRFIFAKAWPAPARLAAAAAETAIFREAN